MLDTLFVYFLGEFPDPDLYPVPYNLYYVSRYIIGILFLVLILDLFKMIKKWF